MNTTADIIIESFEFEDVEVSFRAVTQRGKEWMAQRFGEGAVGATVRKSYLQQVLFDAKKDRLIALLIT